MDDVKQFTPKECTFLRYETALGYRNGELGLGTWCRCLFSCIIRIFHTQENTDSRAEIFGAWTHFPRLGTVKLAQIGILSWHDLATDFIAWAKHLIRQNRIPRHADHTSESFFYQEFISYYTQQFSKSSDITLQRAFVRTCAMRLDNRFFFPAATGQTTRAAVQAPFVNLLSYVDADRFLESDMHEAHKQYFLRMKYGASACSVQKIGEQWCAQAQGKTVLRISDVPCRFHKLHVEQNTLEIYGILDTLLMPYLQMHPETQFHVYALVNQTTRQEVPIFDSSLSYVQSYEKTSYVAFFRCCVDLTQLHSVTFIGEIQGVPVPLSFSLDTTMPMSPHHTVWHAQNFALAYHDGTFVRQEEISVTEHKKALLSSADEICAGIGKYANTRIWLYSDYRSVPFDNGCYQFVHDFTKQDGVERYYITNADGYVPDLLSDPKYQGHLVPYGSTQHQILFLSMEKLFAAYVDAPDNVCPLSPEAWAEYGHFYHGEIIYLQHGVLQAHIPWKYSPVSTQFHADKIVVSSAFEIENLTQTYHFFSDQLMPCGMPRFDHIPKSRHATRKILYAPSWRAYVSNMTQTSFWKGICDFLQSQDTYHFLEKYNLTLEFKPHPMLVASCPQLDLPGDRIRVQTHKVDPAEYQICITDFSSYVFDFVWQVIPVVYYLPDEEAFSNGEYQYKSLDLPWASGFGPYTTCTKDLLRALDQIVVQEFQPAPEYQARMENFFLPLANCSDHIYDLASQKEVQK